MAAILLRPQSFLGLSMISKNRTIDIVNCIVTILMSDSYEISKSKNTRLLFVFVIFESTRLKTG